MWKKKELAVTEKNTTLEEKDRNLEHNKVVLNTLLQKKFIPLRKQLFSENKILNEEELKYKASLLVEDAVVKLTSNFDSVKKNELLSINKQVTKQFATSIVESVEDYERFGIKKAVDQLASNLDATVKNSQYTMTYLKYLKKRMLTGLSRFCDPKRQPGETRATAMRAQTRIRQTQKAH